MVYKNLTVFFLSLDRAVQGAVVRSHSHPQGLILADGDNIGDQTALQHSSKSDLWALGFSDTRSCLSFLPCVQSILITARAPTSIYQPLFVGCFVVGWVVVLLLVG